MLALQSVINIKIVHYCLLLFLGFGLLWQAASAHQKKMVYQLKNEKNEQYILSIHDKSENHTQQSLYEYRHPSNEQIIDREYFERQAGEYLVQGSDLSTWISTTPVYHLKDLQQALYKNMDKKQCSSKSRAVKSQDLKQQNFYGKALLLQKPEAIKTINYRCNHQEHVFTITFEQGANAALKMNNDGQLQKVVSMHNGKLQELILQ